MTAKHAFMIIAHDQFDLLKILITMLDDERNDIYVHVDSKAQDFNADEFVSLTKHAGLFFTDRISVTWGDYSQIEAEMILLKAAVKNEINRNRYAYFHLLSGCDLPIKTNDEIHRFFAEHQGKEFIHFSEDEPSRSAMSRVRYYHIFRSNRNLFYKILAQFALMAQKILGVNRLKSEPINVWKGTNWFSITDDFANYVVSKESEIKKIFSYSYCCDEVFLQTIFMNSPFKDRLYMPHCNNNQLACARYIDWQRGNPYTFTSEDFESIISSPAMFARKFSMHLDKEIVYKIRDYIGDKVNEQQT